MWPAGLPSFLGCSWLGTGPSGPSSPRRGLRGLPPRSPRLEVPGPGEAKTGNQVLAWDFAAFARASQLPCASASPHRSLPGELVNHQPLCFLFPFSPTRMKLPSSFQAALLNRQRSKGSGRWSIHVRCHSSVLPFWVADTSKSCKQECLPVASDSEASCVILHHRHLRQALGDRPTRSPAKAMSVLLGHPAA
jgi:hypothetical protein